MKSITGKQLKNIKRRVLAKQAELGLNDKQMQAVLGMADGFMYNLQKQQYIRLKTARTIADSIGIPLWELCTPLKDDKPAKVQPAEPEAETPPAAEITLDTDRALYVPQEQPVTVEDRKLQLLERIVAMQERLIGELL